MIKIVDRAAFKAQVHAWMAKVRKGAENAVWRMVFDAQITATSLSPTYSGDFASNWNVSHGKPDASFTGTAKGYESLKAGPIDSPAGLSAGNFNMTGFRLGQTAYLANASTHDEPYAMLIENGKINFRPVNVGKDHVLAKAQAQIARRYPKITAAMMRPVGGV